MDKIVAYIPKDCDSSELKKAEKQIEKFKKHGFEVERVSSFEEMNYKSFNVGVLYKVATSILRVRQRPTALSKCVANIKKGEVYTIVEVNDGWGKLKSGIGWVSMKYMRRWN